MKELFLLCGLALLAACQTGGTLLVKHTCPKGCVLDGQCVDSTSEHCGIDEVCTDCDGGTCSIEGDCVTEGAPS